MLVISTRIAAEAEDFDPLQIVDAKNARKMDRFILFALAASDVAVRSSGLVITPEISERVGVHIGSGIGGFGTIEREHQTYLKKGSRRISPFFIPASIVNLAAGHVSIRFGAAGPNTATCTACAAGAHAVGDSFKIIQRGDADAMIAGGSEAAITPMGIGGFASMKALSTRNDAPEKASRPFDLQRDGFVVGEGSGILVLEELEHAKARGASIFAEVVGYGMSGDAHHITAPPEDGNGAVRVMRATLRDAGIEPERVDYINAHGTSTPPNDRIETRVESEIRSAFGLARQLISEEKAQFGPPARTAVAEGSPRPDPHRCSTIAQRRGRWRSFWSVPSPHARDPACEAAYRDDEYWIRVPHPIAASFCVTPLPKPMSRSPTG